MKSNCLIQTIKHRIKYGYQTYICWPLHFDFPHFIWYDASTQKYMQFTTDKKNKGERFNPLWFKGEIREFDKIDLIEKGVIGDKEWGWKLIHISKG